MVLAVYNMKVICELHNNMVKSFFFFLSFVIFKRIHISIVVQAKNELENDDADTTQYGSLVLGKSL